MVLPLLLVRAWLGYQDHAGAPRDGAAGGDAFCLGVHEVADEVGAGCWNIEGVDIVACCASCIAGVIVRGDYIAIAIKQVYAKDIQPVGTAGIAESNGVGAALAEFAEAAFAVDIGCREAE